MEYPCGYIYLLKKEILEMTSFQEPLFQIFQMIGPSQNVGPKKIFSPAD